MTQNQDCRAVPVAEAINVHSKHWEFAALVYAMYYVADIFSILYIHRRIYATVTNIFIAGEGIM